MNFTSEIETFRRGKRDLDEMRMLKLSIPGQVINDGDRSFLTGLIRLGLGPYYGPFRAAL